MKYKIRTLQQKLSGAIVICIALITFTSPIASGYNDAGTDLEPDNRANFTLVEYSYEVRCGTKVALIHWQSGEETNVTNYRIHRRTVLPTPEGEIPSYTDPTWVTATHMVARGSGSIYKIVDAQIEMGTTYNYRLYGYGVNLMLSEAQNLSLDQTMTPTCICLPLIHH